MTPEQLVKRSCCDWLEYQRKRGVDVLFWIQESQGTYDPIRKIWRKKNSPYQRKGISDILGSWKGKPMAIEIKAGRNQPSPEQEQFLKDCKEHGWIAFVARCVDDLIDNLHA